MDLREKLGQLVREAWVDYCLEIGDDKPSHIASWEELSDADKEADRRIGETVARYVLSVSQTYIEPDRPNLRQLSDSELKSYWHSLHNGVIRDRIGEKYAELDNSAILKEAGIRFFAVECSCGLRGTCPPDWKCTENLMWLEPDKE